MMKNKLSRAAKFAAILCVGISTANTYSQTVRAGTARGGTQAASSQKAQECKQALTDAAVNCGAAVVSGAAAVVTLEPPANVIVGVGVPVGVCANEASKAAEACGSAKIAGDKPNISK